MLCTEDSLKLNVQEKHLSLDLHISFIYIFGKLEFAKFYSVKVFTTSFHSPSSLYLLMTFIWKSEVAQFC